MAERNGLFAEANGPRNGRGRWLQRLFIPSFLRREGEAFLTEDDAFRNAYETLTRWARLESSGKLQGRNESELEAEFITDVFAGALGYTLFSEDLPEWHVRPKYALPDGQEADAALGTFTPQRRYPPTVLVELKGPDIDLDRFRAKGRTPVDQLWDYLIAVPECPWGILSNLVSIRLYHRNKTKRVYQEFLLQDLLEKKVFRDFYVVFRRQGLLSVAGAQPRAEKLLADTEHRQRDVGPELYKLYHQQRGLLIDCLTRAPHDMSLDSAIRVAQKLLDRIIFVAFCEDRGLLPENVIEKAWGQLPPFSKVTNPRWRNFLDLFHSINAGREDDGIWPYDGGLFRGDDEVDDLQLPDARTEIFKSIAAYDFSAEVNLEVLGHIFEQSVNDIERFRAGGGFALTAQAAAPGPKMPKSAQRKTQGIYYTPEDFTEFIAGSTIGQVVAARLEALAAEHNVDPKGDQGDKSDPRLGEYWKEAFQTLRQVKVCDPACGSGAFLIRAYDFLTGEYLDIAGALSLHDPALAEQLEEQIPDVILNDNLHGVDLSREAVEITQLALWIRSARPGKSLRDLSANIVCGNSLVSDPRVDARALEWRRAFPTVFDRPEGGFDCIIGNPPWERMKLQEREFFDASAPRIAQAVSAATRRKLIADLEKSNPQLQRLYIQAKESAEKTLRHVRDSGRFPLTAFGDINTYMLFAELARTILAPHGRGGLLVPSGIATDNTTRRFFSDVVNSKSLIALYDFENRKKLFPDVDGRFKFSVFLFGGSEAKCETADFVFFAHGMADLKKRDRQISLSPGDFKLFNPNTRTCPIFRGRRDAQITRGIYRRVPILVDKARKAGGNPWGVRFITMLHQTNDAELFHTAGQLQEAGFRLKGNRWVKGKRVFLPLYEAKMVQAYDHRAAGVVVDQKNWMRQGQTDRTSLVQHQNPEFLTVPRWWVDEGEVGRKLGEERKEWFLGFKDITSATNQRTVISAVIPRSAVTNHFPLVIVEAAPRLEMCLLGNLNSFVYDYVARQKVGAVTLNFFIVAQLPALPPDRYARPCPWEKNRSLERWVSDRVLRLTCTAEDMRPLGLACGLRPPVVKWDPQERAQWLAELDAAYFLLYGVEREDAEYILSTFPCATRPSHDVLGGATVAEGVLREYDRLREA